jgi:crotonobetainyl-CoA:carnitine CoA-transferase CaiB-like acyl-CoA transferase
VNEGRERTLSAPLAGVRVLDISTMIAAPLTSSYLADWGADVVKIERPGTGDHVRRFGAQHDGEGLYWKTLSRNKRSLALDLHAPAAQTLLRRLVRRFDVLIENFRPGTLERWGIGPDELRREAPGLIVLRVTAFGQNGPYRDTPGFGTLAEAMSGLAAVTGFEDRPPLLPPVPLADVLAGTLGSSAVLAALVRKNATGAGEVIDLAIYEAMLKLVELQIIEYDQNGTLHRRIGNSIEDTAPRGAYLCGDGLWIALSASTQSVAERVLRTIGGEEAVTDPRFRTNLERVRHIAELDALIGEWCAERSRAKAIETLSAAGCAVGPLENIASMLENPQIVARESVIRVNDPNLGAVRMTNVFPRFLTTGAKALEPGPRQIGAHSREILRTELALSDDEIVELVRSGAVEAPELAERA